MGRNKERPVFDYRYCMACRNCVSACPFSCLAAERTELDSYNKTYPELIIEERCTGCGLCADSCPLDIIIMEAPAS